MYIYTYYILYMCICLHTYLCIDTYIYIYIYIKKNMHKNTFELIPLKTILTKKIITNEAEISKERMELPNGWKFLCYPYSL